MQDLLAVLVEHEEIGLADGDAGQEDTPRVAQHGRRDARIGDDHVAGRLRQVDDLRLVIAERERL